MPELKLIWKGDTAYCGRVKIALIWFNGSRPKGSEDCIATTCFMPGIKNHLGNFKTDEQAKLKIEHAFNHWLKMLQDDSF